MNAFIKKAASVAVTASMVATAFGPMVAPMAHAAAGDLSISCGNVSINGNVWTISGTWSAIDFPGQDSAYKEAPS